MSNKGHIPVRMCIGCGKRRSKQEMVRLTQMSDRVVREDQKGRGLYLCPDSDCLRKAQRRKGVGVLAEIALIKGADSRKG